MNKKNNKGITEQISISIIKLLNYSNDNEVDCIKLKIGIEILLVNIYKIIFVFLVSVLFNILKEMIIIIAAFSILRKYTFGLHAMDSKVCTLITLVLFSSGVILSRFLILSNLIIFILYILYFILIFKYAPCDTESHPLLSYNLRISLRNKSIVTNLILMLITLNLSDHRTKILILFGVLLVVISILPITYKLMNRRYKNYEYY